MGPPGDEAPDPSGSGRSAWEAAAATVARRVGRLAADAPDAQVWSALTTTTVEGIAVRPLGVPSGVSDTGDLGIRPGWRVCTLISEPDAVRAAQDVNDDLAGGAHSLWVVVGGGSFGTDALPTVLAGTDPSRTPVVMETDGEVSDQTAADAFLSWLTGFPAQAAGTSFGLDPLSRGFRARMAGQDGFDLASTARQAADLGIGAITIDGLAVAEAGAGESAELGYLLAAGAAYLRHLESAGLDLATSLSLIAVRVSATAEQFLTLAKVRALRMLWAALADGCGAGPGDRRVRIHSVTSRTLMSARDPWTNLIRTTIAAFAAGVGGADAVTVLPFDTTVGLPDRSSRRFARNVSHLLLAEAGLDSLTDPASGSFAIEELTRSLAEAGWDEFRRIEAAGGIAAAIADGSLRQRFSVTAGERQRRRADGRMVVVGETAYPAADPPPARRPHPPGDRVLEVLGSAGAPGPAEAAR